MHNTQCAEEFGSLGKFFIKRKPYKPKKRIDELDHYINVNTEIVVYIHKIYAQHWLFKEIPFDFKTNCLNRWDVHPINITKICTIGRNYTILAETSKGPAIIEHRNTVALQFVISANFPETVRILNNFITAKYTEINNKAKRSCDLDYAKRLEKLACAKYNFALNRSIDKSPIEERKVNKFSNKLLSSSFDLNIGVGMKIQNHTRIFAHSGWNYSKRHGILVVENNALNDSKLTLKTTPLKYLTPARLQKLNMKSSEHKAKNINLLMKPINTLSAKNSHCEYDSIEKIMNKRMTRNLNKSALQNYSTIDSTLSYSNTNVYQPHYISSVLRTNDGKHKPRSKSGMRYYSDRRKLDKLSMPPILSSGYGKCIQYISMNDCNNNSEIVKNKFNII